MTGAALTYYYTARLALREAYRLEEVKAVLDEARRTAESTDDRMLFRVAREIELRAYRRIGKMLLAEQRRGRRPWHYKLKPYGLSLGGYVDLWLTLKDGLCPICCQRQADAIDHDHTTGAMRGLLCTRCNAGLGFFGDSPETLTSAAAYFTLATEAEAK